MEGGEKGSVFNRQSRRGTGESGGVGGLRERRGGGVNLNVPRRTKSKGGYNSLVSERLDTKNLPLQGREEKSERGNGSKSRTNRKPQDEELIREKPF